MKAHSIASLVRPCIARLTPYSTARDDYQGELGVFLDANESPYENGYNRYPDPHQAALKALISPMKGLPAENIFLGNGSDEAIDLVFRVFCEPRVDNVVAIAPSYGMYTVAAAINDVAVREVPLGPEFSLPKAELLAAADAHTKALFLCSPNNPTGNAFAREDLLELVEAFEGIVVVDEAYIDFSSVPSLAAEVRRYPNLIVLQTMSKARGMAGLRLGLALADAPIIRLMSMVKYPYNINEAAQRLVADLLRRPIDDQVACIVQQRGVVAERLRALPVVERVYPSDANFLLVKVRDADAAYEHLVQRGIIVRNRNRVLQCAGCLRITVGLPEENEKMLQSLAEL
ncbi:MAG: histidinol-phosphate transaminase [Akkermansia muciniphila]|nr:histidinol-phosphate transaminase [Akkermansia muciniphila]